MLAAGALLGASALGGPAVADASPLDPGITTYPTVLEVPDCSTPRLAPGQPGWSEVVCNVGAHRYVVPPGVHQLHVNVIAAAGGSGGGGAPGGAGGQIKAAIVVTPGQLLEMAVGGAGARVRGGFNGGGDDSRVGAGGRTASGGGGGSSDIRVGDTGVWTRIISAPGGGGGGAAGSGGAAGGNGGRNAHIGQQAPGPLGGAGGGPSTSTGSGVGGGSGATAGTAGSLVDLVGGSGGAGAAGAGDSRGGDGGGGGGGYGFGGGGAGGAGATAGGGGGGGGSPFVNPAWLVPGSKVFHLSGAATGNGSIVITYHAPPIVCGQTLYGSMTLTGNLDCRGLGDGVILAGEGGDQEVNTPIVLDLGGYTLRGDSGGTGVVVSQHDGTVQDGTIRGFAVGVGSQPYARPFDHSAISITVSHATITSGGTGVSSIGGIFGSDTYVDHSVIEDMSEWAVNAVGDSGVGQVTDSTIRDTEDGFDTNLVQTIARNDVFIGNGSALDAFTDGVDLEDNTAIGNEYALATSSPWAGVPGITPDQAAITITGNVVRGTENSGITVLGGARSGSVVSGNHLAGNGTDPRPADPGAQDPGDPGDGLLVQLDPSSAANLTVIGNAAHGNSGWGIDAIGVTDGGGNLASGNAIGKHCRGVACAGG